MSFTDKESVKRILNDIKEVITGEKELEVVDKEEEEILELTEVMQEDGSIEHIESKTEAAPAGKAAEAAPAGKAAEAAPAGKAAEAAPAGKAAEVAPASNAAEAAPASNAAEAAPAGKAAEAAPAGKAAEAAPASNAAEAAPADKAVEAVPAGKADEGAPAGKAVGYKTIANQTEVKSNSQEEHASLISEDAAKSSSESIKNLVNLLHKEDSFSFRGNVTLEELVVEALKPQLSAWLDKNLPNLVRSIVEKEIRRLIPEE